MNSALPETRAVGNLDFLDRIVRGSGIANLKLTSALAAASELLQREADRNADDPEVHFWLAMAEAGLGETEQRFRP